MDEALQMRGRVWQGVVNNSIWYEDRKADEHSEAFVAAAAQICHDISFGSIEALASELDRLRKRIGDVPDRR
jgi:hypothetical protein